MAENTGIEVIAPDRAAYMLKQYQSGVAPSNALATYQEDIFSLARDASRRSIEAMPWLLPQLPETWADEIFERIESEERALIADDYEMGTATQPDDIVEVTGDSSNDLFVFTAEHATQPVRFKTGKREMADLGTGGLAAVLGQDFGRALIMVGDQTSNAPLDATHPIKARIEPYAVELDGFVAVHGMAGGKFLQPHDRTEIQAILGLGAEPSDAEYERAEKIVQAARDLGLRVIIGNDHPYFVQQNHSHELKRNETNQPYQNRLAAERPTTTTNFVRQLLGAQDRQKSAFQVELSGFLRYMPEEDEVRDPKSRIMGVALGYVLMKNMVETMKALDV